VLSPKEINESILLGLSFEGDDTLDRNFLCEHGDIFPRGRIVAMLAIQNCNLADRVWGLLGKSTEFECCHFIEIK